MVLRAAAVGSGETPQGDAQAGAKHFKLFCSHCHSIQQEDKEEKKKYGPTLWGVYGRSRSPGVVDKPSSGVEWRGDLWDSAALLAYIGEPGHATGTDGWKHFQGIKDLKTRADIVQYLRTLSGNDPDTLA
eukprot:TRINITY_DN109642_c0_g1_i1.p1 TRINITY_DN109642_c0_g1~~TRINITY_DN109642_c0_g1_i1.p1  ORF type:complete len:130 (-),score=19.42 TRINITY_DN109642_c0_g1_i1:30-419(-)